MSKGLPAFGRPARGRLWRLCRKELRETLRDRRTILTLVMMPILVYPLLSILFQKFLSTSMQREQEPTYVIGVASQGDKQELTEWLRRGDELIEQSKRQFRDSLYAITLPRDAKHEIQVVGKPLEQSVKEIEIDLGVRLTPLPRGRPNRNGWIPHVYTLVHRRNAPLSEGAMDYVEARLNAINMMSLRNKLANSPAGNAYLAVMSREEVQSRAPGMVSLGTLVPLILILMTITGAVYPAIDLTAGERERGTLETLIAAPIPRLSILFAKYVAVLTVASLTAAVNLLAMTVTALSSGMAPVLFGSSGMTATVVIQVFLLMLVFAGFFSAMLLALTSLARSFKEAQAYTIPLMLISITPGVISLFPSVKLNGWLSAMPLINIVLLTKDLFAGQAVLGYALAAIFSTVLYAIAALSVAARVFGTDAVLYGSSGTWGDLLKRPRQSRAVPTVSQAVMCLAMIFPFHFILSSWLGGLSDATLMQRLSLGAVILMFLFGGFPLLGCQWQRVSLRTGFRVSPFHWRGGVAAILLGVAVWPFAYELALISNEFLAVQPSPEKMALIQRFAEQLKESSLFVVLATLALAPAVFEELFFRGYLFSAFRRAYKPWQAIVFSGVVFGLFHVLVMDRLAIERLLPTTLMGLILGFVAYRTGSVVPSIILHALHNGFMLSINHYRDQLEHILGAAQDQEHLPLWLLLTATGICTVGVLLLSGRLQSPAAVETDTEVDLAHT